MPGFEVGRQVAAPGDEDPEGLGVTPGDVVGTVVDVGAVDGVWCGAAVAPVGVAVGLPGVTVTLDVGAIVGAFPAGPIDVPPPHPATK